LKKALLPFLYLLILFSCKKKDHDVDTPLPKEDSLGTGWTKSSPVAGNSYISDIFFIGNTGFFSSNNSIYKSINGGDSWQKVYQSNFGFPNIGMGSAENAGFASGMSQVFFTTNSGTSFDSTQLAGNSFSDIFYVAPQVAYALSNKLWKSTNGGENWTSIYTFPVSSSSYNMLFFLNEQVGWARVNHVLYKTVNGGVNWTPITNHGLADSQYGEVFFIDQNTGYYGNETTLKKTTDGGANWSTVYTSAYGGYHDLHFINSQLGYLTDHKLVVKTVDGGATWTREANLENGASAVELHFTDADHGWVGTGSGTILKFRK
jgi:photosystem II stability/assembly factor-like uncharacterized protein